MNRFDSVLVANRGEIAVRILRTARALGYRCIAVYSDADAAAPHVAMADEAVRLGPAPAQDSYLNAERVIDAARRSGAAAVHPGYGFLSENAAFARACGDAGLVFIGPSPAAIELMGNKAAAKRRMLDAGVPCVPGYQGADQSDAALRRAAADIGAPLMVKAAAGGGGRGMRLVHDLDALPAALEAARSEAQNAFGSSELILERAVIRARHVEVQVFGDEHGGLIHLGERDCSVQRRHQKVVEEAPCPVMTPALREAMGAAAVTAARSIDYLGAGTVEFLLDDSGEFYFLEMNTRLQVEHPVTELVTGLDLVALQLQVAQGEALPLTQAEVKLCGHAVEVRLYAEDVDNDFLPASGTVQRWQPPAGEGIRVDAGLTGGQDISPFYDPMVAKIIASGADREQARRRLLRALRGTGLFGLPSNRQFLVAVLERPAFVAGAATTAFIDEEFPGGWQPPHPEDAVLCCAALLQYRAAQADALRRSGAPLTGLIGFSAGREIISDFVYAVAGAAQPVALRGASAEDFVASVAGRDYHLTLVGDAAGVARLRIDGLQLSVPYCHRDAATVELLYRGATFVLTNALAVGASAADAGGSGRVLAPMHGNVLKLLVSAGERVAAGDDLAVVEAMKMEHRVRAGTAGVVTALSCREGEQVAAGAVLLEIVADGEVEGDA